MSISAITDRRVHIQPSDVHNVLSRHMLADGYDVVMDLNRSKGSWLFDARRGRAVLDFFTNFASIPIGYNHPRLDNPEFRDRIATAAINKPANSDIYTTYMAEFVETFSRLAVPPSLNKHMFFIEGGALGIENAVKTAFDWKVRKNMRKGLGERGTQIMHLREAFHGRTGYTLSLTNTDPKKTQYFPKFDWPRIENPKLKFPLTQSVVEDVEQREQAAIAQAKQFLAERKDDVAAFIMEPIQGEGGDNHFRPEFFRAVRQLCDENDVLLIFDEVQSGVGLTGKMWAFQHYGVEPDLFCFGKKTQVCGFAAGERIFDIDDNVFAVSSRINSTWGGNLTDMVRSQRYFEVIDEEDLVENAATVGAYFVGELQRFAEEFPTLVSNVRGRGLMAAFDLPSGEVRDTALKSFMANDVMVLSSGNRSARFRPSLNLSMDEAAEGIKRMEKALQELA
ncbi:MAG: L-lysine 6-transaminase [Acidobacteria bacterium]|nr:L-lysine 6-transaminase [Acidobacteriota bacterium]MBV9070212.1 L-lysine 6-transaminase [Acidobacteriota bacterium]MBV9184357.1 L-lysine 6-transaminase [Acidobacteriota bacterium]